MFEKSVRATELEETSFLLAETRKFQKQFEQNLQLTPRKEVLLALTELQWKIQLTKRRENSAGRNAANIIR